MLLELIPVLVGLLFAAAGAALIADAVIPDGTFVTHERRRRPRPARNTPGEAALGFGMLCLAAALIGRDTWPYATVAVLAATVLLGAGVALNWAYVRGLAFGSAPTPRFDSDASDSSPAAPGSSG